VSRKGEMFFYLLYGTSFLYQRHVLTVIGYALLPHYGGITWSESFRHVLDTLKERVKWSGKSSHCCHMVWKAVHLGALSYFASQRQLFLDCTLNLLCKLPWTVSLVATTYLQGFEWVFGSGAEM
jgi:hypothetical protein